MARAAQTNEKEQSMFSQTIAARTIPIVEDSPRLPAGETIIDPRDGHGKAIEGWDRRSRLAYLPV